MATLTQLAGQAFSIQLTVIIAISQDYGSFDFTVTGTAKSGRYISPPTYPFFAIDPIGITSEDDAAPLGAYEKTATYLIEAWAQVANDTELSVSQYGQALAGALVGAIQDAHQDAAGSLKALGTRRVNVSDIEFLNTETPGKKEAHFRGTLEVTYKVISGGNSGI